MLAARREHMDEGAGDRVARIDPDPLGLIDLRIVHEQHAARSGARVVIELSDSCADMHRKAGASGRRCVDSEDREIRAQPAHRRDTDDVGAGVVDIADVALYVQGLPALEPVDRDSHGRGAQAGVIVRVEQIAVAIERLQLELGQRSDSRPREVARSNLECSAMIAIDQRPCAHGGAAGAAGGRRGRGDAIGLLIRHPDRPGGGECWRTERDECGHDN
jgi:hypothetical protein